MLRLGFNTKQNLGSQNRTTTSVSLGKTRNSLGSITRKYNYCSRTSLYPLYCTFDSSVPPVSGQFQIALGNGIFYVSTDFGITWNSKPQFASYNLKGIALSDDLKYILAGGGYPATPLFYSNNGGKTFTQKIGVKDWFNIKMSKSGQYQTAIGPINEVYVSNDYGATFVDKGLLGVGGNEDSFLAMSYDGKYQTITTTDMITPNIWRSNDYGNNWTNINVSTIVTNGYMVGIAMSGDGKIQTTINGSSSGEIYTSTNYGQTWTTNINNIPSAVSPYYIALSETAKYQLYSDYGGFIWVSRDFGYTWTNNINIDGQLQSLFGTSGWYPCAVSSTGQYQTICNYDDGFIYTSSDFGYNWFKRPSSNSGGGNTWWGVNMS